MLLTVIVFHSLRVTLIASAWLSDRVAHVQLSKWLVGRVCKALPAKGFCLPLPRDSLICMLSI